MDTTAKERILNLCVELGEDIDSPNCRKLREYVKACPNCEAFVDSVKKTITLYQCYTPKHSDRIKKRLFKKLDLL